MKLPDMSEYIKLYQSLIDHPVFTDHKALVVFVYYMLLANKIGKGRVGRYSGAKATGMKPMAFYKVQKRLEEKYEIVKHESNKYHTEFTILHWRKYQNSGTGLATGLGTGENPQVEDVSGTELGTELGTHNKNYIYSSIKSLTNEDLLELAKKYQISLTSTKSVLDDLENYCQAHGKQYKNYKSALNNFIKSALKSKDIAPLTPAMVEYYNMMGTWK